MTCQVGERDGRRAKRGRDLLHLTLGSRSNLARSVNIVTVQTLVRRLVHFDFEFKHDQPSEPYQIVVLPEPELSPLQLPDLLVERK